MNGDGVVDVLTNALTTWNTKLTEVWALVSMSPEDFRGGSIWSVVAAINDALQAIGLSLLVLFFFFSLFKSVSGFSDFKRPEVAFRLFARLLVAKAAVTHSLYVMKSIFSICTSVTSSIAGYMGEVMPAASLPTEIVTATSDLGILESLLLMVIAFLSNFIILGLSMVMILVVYSRFFKLFMYTAIAPVPLAAFAGDVTLPMGKAFVKSYAGVCLQGSLIMLACVIYTAYLSSMPITSALGDSVFTMVLSYTFETVLSMLVLIGAVKCSDILVKEMMGL